MKRITLRIGLSCILCSLALLSCGQWNYKFCNPYDPNATYDVVYSSGIVPSHTVASSEQWSGTVTITGDITVPAGCVLALAPGTMAIIQKNVSDPIEITCGGTFFAVGSASAPVVIRSTDGVSNAAWGRILIPGGSAMVEYCVIQDASWGLWISSTGRNVLRHVYFNNCANPALQTEYYCAGALVANHLTFDACGRGWYNRASLTLSYCDFSGCSEAVFLDNYTAGSTTTIEHCNFASSGLADISVTVDSPTSSLPTVDIRYSYPASPTSRLSYYSTSDTGVYSPNISEGQTSAVSDAGCGFDYSAYKR